MEHLS
jgi:hypothetical protein